MASSRPEPRVSAGRDRTTHVRLTDHPPTAARRIPRRAEAGRASTAVGYCRRSTDRQEQSIPDQQRAIQRHCDENGVNLLRWYVDDAISGTSALGRRAFQEMVAEAQRPGSPFGLIVVYDVKRFGRVDNDEAGYYRHVLKTHGVEVVYTSEGFNGGETDDLLRPVKQWQARQESKDLSKVTIRGLLSKAEGGWWMGGVAPHGYDLRYENERGEFLFTLRHMPDGTKEVLDQHGRRTRTLARGESLAVSKRDHARLIPGEAVRVKTVRRIFSLYVDEGRGLKAISDELNRTGTPTPRDAGWSHIYAGKPVEGRRGWRDSTVRAILVNPIYAGDMVWNRRTDARFHMIAQGRAVERRQAHGARLVPNDETEWIVIPGTHPGLISRAVCEKAKSIRLDRPACAKQVGVARSSGVHAPGGWSGARSRFALSGLVRCSLCGSRYQGVTRQKGKPRNDGTLVRTFSYACGGYVTKGTSSCSYNPVGQAQLESAVADAVLAFYCRYEGTDGKARLARAARDALGTETADLAEARKRVDAERAGLESAIAAILDNLTPANRGLAERRLAELGKERARADARHGELERLAGEQTRVQTVVHEVARFLGSLEFTLKEGLPAERLAALRRCVQEVVVDKPAAVARVSIRTLPVPSLSGVVAEVVEARLDGACATRSTTPKSPSRIGRAAAGDGAEGEEPMCKEFPMKTKKTQPKKTNATKPSKTKRSFRPAAKPATKGARGSTGRMSGLDAAAKVLAASDKPLTCGDLVATMLKRGYWSSGGKTPAATINAAMLREITAKGATSRFRKTGRGLFAAKGGGVKMVAARVKEAAAAG